MPLRCILRLTLPVSVLLSISALLALGEDKLRLEFLREHEKLSREMNPIGKAKVLIKLSNLHLQAAADSISKEDFAKADRSFEHYGEVVAQTVTTLQSSGRDAQKNPSGFKDFEISLRKQLRLLEDLKSRYSFDQIQKISRAIETAKSAQDKMFVHLFGAENAGRPRSEEEHSASKEIR